MLCRLGRDSDSQIILVLNCWLPVLNFKAPTVVAKESKSVEMTKNLGCFWPTSVWKQQKPGIELPADRLTKYREKNSKIWTEGLWMYGPLDTLVPGAINLVGKNVTGIEKNLAVTEDLQGAYGLWPHSYASDMASALAMAQGKP